MPTCKSLKLPSLFDGPLPIKLTASYHTIVNISYPGFKKSPEETKSDSQKMFLSLVMCTLRLFYLRRKIPFFLGLSVIICFKYLRVNLLNLYVTNIYLHGGSLSEACAMFLLICLPPPVSSEQLNIFHTCAIPTQSMALTSSHKTQPNFNFPLLSRRSRIRCLLLPHSSVPLVSMPST